MLSKMEKVKGGQQMIKKLIQFSMDLHDIDSRATVSVESDYLIIDFGDIRQIVIWESNGTLYPEINHRFEELNAIELETIKKVLELIEKYEEDSK